MRHRRVRRTAGLKTSRTCAVSLFLLLEETQTTETSRRTVTPRAFPFNFTQVLFRLSVFRRSRPGGLASHLLLSAKKVAFKVKRQTVIANLASIKSLMCSTVPLSEGDSALAHQSTSEGRASNSRPIACSDFSSGTNADTNRPFRVFLRTFY